FPGAAATLSARLGDPRLEGAAADALVALGAAAVPALARALAADDPAMAAGAAHILGDLGAPEAVPALVGALAPADEGAAAAPRAPGGGGVARPEAVRPHLFPLDARRCRILYRAAVEADRPALLLALREGDTALRAAAAGVLGLLDAEAETRGALVLA